MRHLKITMAATVLIIALWALPSRAVKTANDVVIIHLPPKPVGQLTEISARTKPSGKTIWDEHETVMAQGDLKINKANQYKMKLNYNGSLDLNFLKVLGPFLRKLDLSGFPVTDEQCKLLKYLPQLEDLDALDSDIGDEALKNIAAMQNLKILTLSRTLVTFKSLPAIGRLKNLTTLYIANVKLNDSALSNLSELHNLVKLRMGSTEIGDAGIAHLAGLTNLVQLHVARNGRITNSGLSKLKNLQKLQDLDISETGVTAACASTLKELPKLKVLSVSYRMLGKAGVIELKKVLPNVRVEDGNASKVPMEMFEPLHSPMPGKSSLLK